MAAKKKAYWLVKSEPAEYSVEDWARDGTVSWDGIRNYQARNHLRRMRRGDGVLFYHSSCDAVGVAGRGEVAREAYPDPSAWDPKSPFFDPKSSREEPCWFRVDLTFGAAADPPVPAARLREVRALSGMTLFRQGRLSVQPVTEEEWRAVLSLTRWKRRGIG